MKKILFSAAAFALVAATSIAVAPTTSEAIPAFARQTGAACLSCHFQEVPALSAFGRAFKMGSFTDVGDQALVEDDNLSIPVTLNATMVVRMNVTNVSGGGITPGAAAVLAVPGNAGTAAVPQIANRNVTAYNIPIDTNFLVAGRVGSNSGAFVEFGGGAADTGQAANNLQFMNSFDVGDFKVGGGYADTSFGADAVMNVSSVYGQHSGAVGDIGGVVGAINNSGFTNSISSIGAWVGNDMGYIQFALVAPGGGAGWVNPFTATQGVTNVGLKLAKLVRVALTMDIAGFDAVIGGGSMAGRIGKAGSNANGPQGTIAGVAAPNTMDMQFLDGQLQGDLGDMSVGIYADWAHAKGTAAGNIMGAQDVGGLLNSGDKFDAFSLRATIEPVSGWTVGAGYGYRKTDLAPITPGVVNPASVKHQVFTAALAYQLYQNSIISLNYNNDKQTLGNGTATNVKTTVLDWITLM